MPAEVPSHKPVVAVAGEAVVDMVATGSGPAGTYRALPGGSPANVAVGLVRLGVPTRMIARIGGDAFGRMLRAHLEGNAVDTRSVVHAPEPSSVAFVHRGGNEPLSFDLRLTGTADWGWTEEELAAAPAGDLAALHVGSLAMVLPPGADLLAAFAGRVRAHATISYDPNCRPDVMAAVPGARERIEALMRAADIVKVSDGDLEWLRPGADPAAFAGELVDGGAALAAVTRGAAGGIVAGPRCAPRTVPGHRVEVVDTVGAGDAYMSALLAGLYARGLLGGGRREALRAVSAGTLTEVCDDAALAAALNCGKAGADPPTRNELEAARPR